MFCIPIMLCLLICITEIIQVTEGCKYKVVQIRPGLFPLVYTQIQSRSYLNHLVLSSMPALSYRMIVKEVPWA